MSVAVLWSRDIVFRLIDLYECYPSLWDYAHPDYRNKAKKREAWDFIADSLKLPSREVELKIHSLRTQFARECRKIVTTESGEDVVASSSWFAFDALAFLLDGMKEYSKKITLNTENRQSPDLNDIEAEMEWTPSSRKKRKKTFTKDEQESILEDTTDVIQNNTVTVNNDLDEYSIYGAYVANELRGVEDEHSVLIAKHHINNILFNVRMGKYVRRRSSQDTRQADDDEDEQVLEHNLQVDTVVEVEAEEDSTL